MKATRFTLVIAATLGIGGCAHPRVLTPGEVGRSGSRQFSAPPDEVLYASVGALKAEGYEVETVDVEHGLIISRAKQVSVPGGSNQAGETTSGRLEPAHLSAYQKRYRVTVSPENGGTRVVAEPSLVKAGRDISQEPVWDLDGPNGEKAQWDSLFADIQSAFPETAKPGQK